MRNTIRSLAVLLALQPVLAAAQQFPSLPANSVIGRLGIGPGPSQAIPFSALAAATGFAKGPQSCSSHNWFNTLSLTGAFGCGQPSFADLTGNIAVSQMNSGTGASASTMWAGDGTWKQPQVTPYTAPNTSPASQTIQAQLSKIPVTCDDIGTCGTSDDTANILAAMQYASAHGRPFLVNRDFNVSDLVISGLSGNLSITGQGSFAGAATGTNGAVVEIKDTTGVTVEGNVSINCRSNAHYGAGLKIWTDGGGSSQFNAPRIAEYANCRTAIQIGDSTQSTATISEITIPTGFTFNVAQGVRVYSSEAVVNMNGFINIVDPTVWTASFTGSCSGSTLTVSGISTNGYLNQYDVLSGTGVTAGTYVTGQSGGTLGGNGTYSLSQSCSSSSAALTSVTRALNYWASGGTVMILGGETVNSVASNGYLCLIDVMASPNAYGNCQFTGGVIETGGSWAAAFNPTGISSPNGGGIQFIGTRGDIGGGTSTIGITTDSTFPGNVTVLGNRLFGSASRSGVNILGGSTATSIYFDLGSFGNNMLQGYAGVSGGTQHMIGNDGQASATVVTGNATQNPGDTMVVFACTATCTYTLLNPTAYPGRELMFTNAAAQAVNSASSNIITIGGTGTSAIFAAAVGKFVRLRADVGLSAWRATASN